MSHLQFIASRWLRACGLAALLLLAFPLDLGSDAWADSAKGLVVISLNVPVMDDGSAADPYRAYYIRAQRTDGSADVHFLWHEGWVVSTDDDLAATGAGHGAVIIKELAPGDWEVNSFRAETHARTRWTPARDFSIPFKVQAGRVTYIGSFQPVGHTYKDLLGLTEFGGPRFVVTDQSARDMPIAKTKRPDMGPVDVDVFDVDRLSNPLLSRGGAVTAAPDESAFSR